MKRTVCIGLMAASILALPVSADSDADGIRQAVLNYADSAYLVKPELVETSVHPKLQKIGYVSREGSEYRELWMNFYELKELAAGWNKEGRFNPASAKRNVTILDQLDRTAVARLDAEWGIDFFHLAKIGDTWMIMNVIWQTYPPDTTAEVEGCSTNADCSEGEYCAFEAGECGGTGSCEERPQMCTMDYSPVCGCDGETYSNACSAAGAGASVRADGECE